MGTITWNAYLPTGTSITVYTRTGADNNPYDGGWSDWQVCDGNQPVPSPDNRYIQYRKENKLDNKFLIAKMEL